MHNDKGYHIKRFTRQNLTDVERLHTAIYGMKPPENYFLKKYDTAYTGLEYVGYLAYTPDGVPIAYYGVIPCFIKHEGDFILAAQSADTMTDPNFRFKGLFVELSNITFQLCRELGIKLAFGFPNQNSAHGAINKLAWRMTETLQCFSVPVKSLPLEKIASRFRFLKKMHHFYIKNVLKKRVLHEKGIKNSIICDGFSGVFRDEAYLNYKTFSSTYVVQLSGAELWFKINNGLIVGDLILNEVDFKEILRQIKKLAAKLGLNQVVFQVSPHSTLSKPLQQHADYVETFPVLFQDFDSGLPLDRIKFTFADIDIF